MVAAAARRARMPRSAFPLLLEVPWKDSKRLLLPVRLCAIARSSCSRREKGGARCEVSCCGGVWWWLVQGQWG